MPMLPRAAVLNAIVLSCDSLSVSRILSGGVKHHTSRRVVRGTAKAIIGSSTTPMDSEPKGHVFIATTLDGKIAESDGSVEFLNEYQSSASNDMGFSAFLDSVDTILMGRKSFDKVVSFGEEMWAYGSKPVVVWTRSIESVVVPTWLELRGTVTCSCLGPKELFQDLKNRGVQTVYVDGGSTIQKFLAEGLIHSMDITTVPLVLGDGIALFSNQSSRISMRHIRTNAYDSGLVQSSYEIIPLSL